MTGGKFTFYNFHSMDANHYTTDGSEHQTTKNIVKTRNKPKYPSLLFRPFGFIVSKTLIYLAF